MSIEEDILNYSHDEQVYNKYISEFEKLASSHESSNDRCRKLFESCQSQLKEIPNLPVGNPPSEELIRAALFLLKNGLQRKTKQLAARILEEANRPSPPIKINDPADIKKFPSVLQVQIYKLKALQHPDNITRENIPWDKLTPNQTFEILCAIVSKIVYFSGGFPDFINKIIKDPEQKYILALIAAQNGALGVVNNLESLGIVKPEQRETIFQAAYLSDIKAYYLNKTTYINLEPFKSSRESAKHMKALIKISLSGDLGSAASKNDIRQALEELIKDAVALGIPEEQIRNWARTIILKADNPKQQIRYMIWLRDLFMRSSFDPKLQALLKDPKMLPTIEALLRNTKPLLQAQALSSLTSVYADSSKKALYLDLIADLPERLYLPALLLTQRGVEKSICERILQSLHAKKYADYQKMQQVNELIYFLSENSDLSLEDQMTLLKMTLIEPEKSERERAPDYKRKLEQFRTSQEHLLVIIPVLLSFDRLDLLQNTSTPEDLIQKWNTFSGQIFNIPDDQLAKFSTLFIQSERYPNGFLYYASRLQTLAPEERAPVNAALRELPKAILEGSFPAMRYNTSKSLHLKTISQNFPSIIEKWKTAVPLDPLNLSAGKYTLEDTDQWEDLFLLGTDVYGSCLNLHERAYYNKCLLALILDGKNRAIVVKDKNGRIVGRSVLKLLWDPKKKEPVLFMDKFYVSHSVGLIPPIHQMLVEGCIQKARSMGLCLVACEENDNIDPKKPTYENKLESLGSSAPYEYVDAKDAITDGVFRIGKNHIIFEPKIESSR
ncbi:MAG: hypothetical protein JSR58_02950 [Verrucomicrobia bacterium]|nr:hypothetical protein [Verrucomicrobiota bacterium]